MSAIESNYIQGKVDSSASTMTFTACRSVAKTSQCQQKKSAFCVTMSSLFMDAPGTWETQDDLDTVTDTADGVKITLENQLDDDDNPIRTELTITCSETESVPITVRTMKTNMLLFEIKMNHPAGCPVSGGGGGGSGGLSGGWIFIIILLSVTAFYVILGCVINVAVRKRAFGKDACPNAGFWGSIPGLVKDGFKWTAGKLGCGKGGRAATADAGSPSDYGTL